MARPIDDGSKYFPFDVVFFSDKKIKSVRAHFGADGIALYLYLLCEIYREGYYIKVDEDFTDCAAADLGLSVDETRQIMKFFCKRSLFDDKLFTADTILTAKSIQRRYQEIKKGLKRDIVVDGKLWLLEKSETSEFIKVRQNSDLSENNPCFSENNPDNSEKNSTKESKVKENKINTTTVTAQVRSAPATAEKSDNEREALVALYGENIVSDYERHFNAWAAKKERVNVSMYPTIRKWIKQDNPMAKPERKPQSKNPFINAVLENGGDFYE